ncbi:hypothetical protein ACF8Q9_20760 [Pseudomonas sp. TYF_15]|nr:MULTISPECIES: hypothetical protein [Pseudomonas]MDD2017663.1 hypothetical protein [Pseudomonas putida]MDF3174148.1 hypothetical protein [Pseudomonas sp. ER28]WRW06665.1 hypothetical protein VPZ82_15035 [Pseudomonas putida]WVM69479.1 hypothetical protein V1687_12495 [Pseudomonas putida]
MRDSIANARLPQRLQAHANQHLFDDAVRTLRPAPGETAAQDPA